MILLPLRYLADDPAVPLHHASGCGVAERFANLATNIWRALPVGVTHRILEGCKYLEKGLAFALLPSLPKVGGGFNRGLWWRESGMFVFSADWIRRRTDEQVEAAIAHEL